MLEHSKLGEKLKQNLQCVLQANYSFYKFEQILYQKLYKQSIICKISNWIQPKSSKSWIIQ